MRIEETQDFETVKRRQVKGSVCKSVKEQLGLDALGRTVPSLMEFEA